jgi:hypothetical protein
VDHKVLRGGKRKNDHLFKVRWLNYGPDDDTWLPYRDVSELEALDVYLVSHPDLNL